MPDPVWMTGVCSPGRRVKASPTGDEPGCAKAGKMMSAASSRKIARFFIFRYP